MGAFKDMILFFYTLALFVLHAAGLYHLIHSEATTGFVYKDLYGYLWLITAVQYLDIPFSLLRLTGSNPYAVFVQVSGRLFVLWAATHMVGWKWALITLIGVYLLSELCRGPYYMANCLQSPNPHLTWLRYNAFKLLYPVGFTCEALVFVNVAFVARKTPIDIKNPQFLQFLAFAVFFLAIVTYLFRSMSRKADKKNKELQKLAKSH